MIHRSARGPRAHRAIKDAIPIAKARGLIQLATGGPETSRISLRGPGTPARKSDYLMQPIDEHRRVHHECGRAVCC